VAPVETVRHRGVCSRPLRPGYRLGGRDLRCLRHAIGHPVVVRRALVTALIVGTVLTAINQGDRILGGDISAGVMVKMGLTYCVPYIVSISGALGAARIVAVGPL
jgi:hypothetical protein